MVNTPSNSDPIIVVGAGWAGLTAAFTLANQGHKVVLLEAAPQAGGRARGISFGRDTVDNGQHLLIGAYHHTLTLLKALKIPEHSVLKRSPLEFLTFDPKNPHNFSHLKVPQLSFPLSWFMGFLNIRGFSFKERLKAIQFCRTIQHKNFLLLEDISVQSLFFNLNQTPSLITKLWEPIALAALSTPIHRASAQIFLQVLKDTFTQTHKNANWLFPKVDLSNLLPHPIIKFLTEQQCPVLYHQRVQQLWIENGECKGVLTATQTFKGKAVVLATPPHVSAQLLNSTVYSRVQCDHLIKNLGKFNYQPITTVYLRYPKLNKIVGRDMIGLIDSTGHWVFNREFAGQPEIFSVVITGEGPHSFLDHQTLVHKLTQEISTLIPLNTSLLDFRVICEKRAAFSCEVGISQYRPPNTTPIPNLWLAGDYTQTRYPATLEGAVFSGIKAANLISLKNEDENYFQNAL